MAVLAYHPETGADLVVSDEQLVHMRASGWMLRTEYEAAQEHAAQQAAAAGAASAKPSKSEGK
jgi:hypothetical protein